MFGVECRTKGTLSDVVGAEVEIDANVALELGRWTTLLQEVKSSRGEI